MVIDVEDFERDVLVRSRTVPVVVDFWAAWCGPCRALGPVLEKLAGEAEGRWVLAKVDTEAHQEVAGALGVQSIPSVMLIVDGRIADRFVGALPEPQVRRWLASALPSPHAAAIAAAREQVADGAFPAAVEALARVLEAEPGNDEARLLSAEALLHTEPARVRGTLAPLDPEGESRDRIAALATLADAATADAGSLPDAPSREGFLAAARAAVAADWDPALEGFIAIVRRRDDPLYTRARACARAVFVLLGTAHPAAERHFRAFSNAVMA
jgi:putative thioredoxin